MFDGCAHAQSTPTADDNGPKSNLSHQIGGGDDHGVEGLDDNRLIELRGNEPNDTDDTEPNQSKDAQVDSPEHDEGWASDRCYAPRVRSKVSENRR